MRLWQVISFLAAMFLAAECLVGNQSIEAAVGSGRLSSLSSVADVESDCQIDAGGFGSSGGTRGSSCTSWNGPVGNESPDHFRISKFKIYFDGNPHERDAVDGSLISLGEITFSGSYSISRQRGVPFRISIKIRHLETGGLLGSLEIPARATWEQSRAQAFMTTSEVLHGHQIAVRAELKDVRGRVLLSDDLNLEMDREAHVDFDGGRSVPILNTGDRPAQQYIRDCSDPGVRVRLWIAERSDGPFREYGSGECRDYMGIARLVVNETPISFFGMLEPGERFWIKATLRDDQGNYWESVREFERGPIAAEVSSPVVGSALSDLESFRVRCSEVGGSLNAEFRSGSTLLGTYQGFCTSDHIGYLGPVNFSAVAPTRPISMNLVHRLDSDLPHIQFESTQNFTKSAAPVTPILSLSRPTTGINTAGRPHFAGQCSPDELIYITSDAPITRTTVVRGTYAGLGQVYCSASGDFEVHLDLNLEGRTNGQMVGVTVQLLDLTRVLELRVSKCPTNSVVPVEFSSIAVDADYQEKDDGEFCRVRNWSIVNGAGYYNVSYHDPVLGRTVPAYIADPEIHRIGNTYYLMGTGLTKGADPNLNDPYATSNFMFLASEDLVNWRYHSMAFDGSLEALGPLERPYGMIKVSGRVGRYSPDVYLCRLWGAHFYIENSTVFLVFNAIEDRTPGQTICRAGEANIDRMTVLVASAPLDHFVSGGFFADSAQERAHEPAWIGYWDGQSWRYDGGASQNKAIPSNGVGDLENQQLWGNRLCHQYWNCNTVMGLDGFVFKDANGERWMSYGWNVHLPNNHPDFPAYGAAWNGNHMAMARVGANPYQMETSAPASDFLSLGYKANQNAIVRDGFKDGCDRVGDSEYCVAEGPSLYRAPENEKYYLTYSRNAWNLSSYRQVYRKADSLRGLGSTDWTKTPDGEQVLAQANNLDLFNEEFQIGGTNFAGGMMFTGPGGRTYIVLHAKEDLGWRRIPYIKEINFDDEGNILSLRESHSNPKQNLAYFLIPRP